MTVKELIEELKQHPDHLRVLAEIYDDDMSIVDIQYDSYRGVVLKPRVID